GLDDVEAAEVFLRLREWAVGGQHLAVGHAHDRCGVGFVQGAAEQPSAGRLQLLLEDADPLHELPHLLLGHRGTDFAVDAVDGQQVLRHRGPPRDGRALPASHPHYERASARLTGRLTWEAATRLAPRLLAPIASDARLSGPSGCTLTKPRIGRPVKSIGRACGLASASSSWSGSRRTINSSPLTPQHIWPATMNVSPPNIFRSLTSVRSASSARTRVASLSS